MNSSSLEVHSAEAATDILLDAIYFESREEVLAREQERKIISTCLDLLDAASGETSSAKIASSLFTNWEVQVALGVLQKFAIRKDVKKKMKEDGRSLKQDVGLPNGNGKKDEDNHSLMEMERLIAIESYRLCGKRVFALCLLSLREMTMKKKKKKENYDGYGDDHNDEDFDNDPFSDVHSVENDKLFAALQGPNTLLAVFFFYNRPMYIVFLF